MFLIIYLHVHLYVYAYIFIYIIYIQIHFLFTRAPSHHTYISTTVLLSIITQCAKCQLPQREVVGSILNWTKADATKKKKNIGHLVKWYFIWYLSLLLLNTTCIIWFRITWLSEILKQSHYVSVRQYYKVNMSSDCHNASNHSLNKDSFFIFL